MFSDKDQWYKDRILWKANQHKLLSDAGRGFKDLDISKQIYIQNQTPLHGEPILAFWSGEDLWTVVTNREIVSQLGATINRMYLDDIHKKIQIISPEFEQNVKEKVEFLLLGEAGIKVWGSTGSSVFGLASVLRMFPMK